jgi:hypothetical protein
MPQRLGLAERSRRSLPRRGCSAKDDEFLIKPTGFGEPMREALWKLGHKARDDGAAILISTAWAKRWTGYLRANLADVPATISARRSSGARGGLPRGRRHQALVHWELALPLHAHRVGSHLRIAGRDLRVERPTRRRTPSSWRHVGDRNTPCPGRRALHEEDMTCGDLAGRCRASHS